ncbi:MAG: DUF3450 family protein, partial [Lachnospiraceae bacterium]|nr:DUF3450 family protein [Lachnospiraceae bacterium]
MIHKIRRLLAAGLVASILLGTIPYRSAYAAPTTKEQLEEAKRQQEEARKNAEKAQDEVDNLTARQRKLKKELKKLQEELQLIFDRIAELEAQIEAKEAEIAETQAALAEARETERVQYESMKQRIRFMYKDSETVYLDIIFHAKSFSDFLTLSRYMESLATYDRSKFDEYQATRIQIEELEAKLQQEKADLDDLMAQAEEEKNNVMAVIEKTQANISEYNDLIDEAEALALQKEKELEAANNQVDKLKKKLEEEERLARLAAQLAWRSISEVHFEP